MSTNTTLILCKSAEEQVWMSPTKSKEPDFFFQMKNGSKLYEILNCFFWKIWREDDRFELCTKFYLIEATQEKNQWFILAII